MGHKDKRVDAHIASSAPFARPILKHLRAAVHAGCPDITEDLKWRMPAFLYGGGILCQMAAFKGHVVFGFWKADGLVDAKHQRGSERGMRQFGRLTSVDDLPSKAILVRYVKAAAKRVDEGVANPRPKAKPKKKAAPRAPAVLSAALAKNARAKAAFSAFAPSHRREYIEWITEAKTDVTRDRRVAQTLEWLSEGKPRHWKYAR